MAFETNMRTIYGKKGEIWLQKLPQLISQLATEWQLINLKPYPNLTYNYVLRGFRGTQPIALKVGIDIPLIQHEHDALQAYANHGAIELIDARMELGALLLKQALPGKTLSTLFPEKDLASMEIACTLATRLHKAPPPKNHTFPRMAEWLQIIDQPWDLPSPLLNQARHLKEILLSHAPPPV